MQPENITIEAIVAQQKGILPNEIKSILANDHLGNALEGIRVIYNLNEATTDAIGKELLVTFLGLDFVSTLPARVEKIVGAAGEAILDDLLESLANMLFADSVLRFLHEYELYVSEQPKKAAIPVTPVATVTPAPTPVNIPVAKTAPEAVVTHAPEPVLARDLPKVAPANIPTGKMVGIKKETTESEVKGMRTMRGDINRLRGPEEGTTSAFTKPFSGK